MTQVTRSGRAPLEWATSQPKRGLRPSRLGAKTATPTITAIPDSGADKSVAGLDTLHALGKSESDLTNKDEDQLVAANSLPLQSVGRLVVAIEYGSRTSRETVITPQTTGLALSWHACIRLGILPEEYPLPLEQHIRRTNQPFPSRAEIVRAKQ